MDWPQAPTLPATAAQAAAACFTDTEGGHAFATEGCGQCLGHTYWR